MNSIQQRLNKIVKEAKERSHQLSVKSRDSSTLSSSGAGQSSLLQSPSQCDSAGALIHLHPLRVAQSTIKIHPDLRANETDGESNRGKPARSVIRQPLSSSALHNIEEERAQNATEPVGSRNYY